MAKVVSWQIDDNTFVYLKSSIRPAITASTSDVAYARFLADEWRSKGFQEYEPAFNEVQSLVNGALTRDAAFYFDVLSDYGTYMLTGRDGEDVPISGVPYYNIHITNQNVAIGLGGDLLLDTAVTVETKLYIEKNNIISNDGVTIEVYEKGKDNPLPYSPTPDDDMYAVTGMGMNLCTVMIYIPAGTSFNTNGKNIEFDIKVVKGTEFSGTTAFTVVGVKNGKEGTVYNLLVIPKTIKKYDNGRYSDQSIICKVANQTSTGLPEGFSVKYSFTSSSASTTAYTDSISVSAMEAASADTVYFWLFNSGEVIDFDDCAIVEDGINASDRIVLELDNEMDGISLGGDSVLDVETTIGSGMKLYSGTSEITISKVIISGLENYEGVVGKIGDEEVAFTQTGATFEHFTPSIEVNFEITFPSGHTFPNDLREILFIDAVGYFGDERNLEASAKYIVLGIKGGEDGEVFKLMPSVNAVVVDTNNGGTMYPLPENGVSCIALRGTEVLDVASSPDFTIGYSIDATYNEYDSRIVTGVTACTTYTSANTDIIFYLFYNTGNGIVLLDRESVSILKNGRDGDTIAYIELRNEVDAVATGTDDVLDVPVTLTTGFETFSGSTALTFTKVELSASEQFDGIDVDMTCRGQVFTETFSAGVATFEVASTSNNGVADLTFHINAGFAFGEDQKETVTIKVTAGNGTILTAIYLIVGLKNGEEGKVYRLDPSVNSIKYDPNTERYDVNVVTCGAYAGVNPIHFIGPELDNGVYSIKYAIDTGDTTVLTDTGITVNSSIKDKITFYLLNKTGQDEWVIIDRETVPVIEEGLAGTSPYTLDLDNQNASVNCDAEGNVLTGAVLPECQATLYYGSSEVSSGVRYTMPSSNVPYTGVSINQNTGEITTTSDLEFNATTLVITIRATYNGITTDTQFNISKNLPGIDGSPATSYWLEPSVSSIKVNKTGLPDPSQISCKAWKQVGAENAVQVDLSTSTDPRVYYAFNATPTVSQVYDGNAYPVTENDNYIYFILGNADLSVKYDIERVPVVKDGIDGASGTPGSSPYTLDLTNQNASINCDAEGNVLAGAVKPTCRAIVYHGNDSSVTSTSTFRIVTGTTENDDVTIASDGTITCGSNFTFSGDILTLTIQAECDGNTLQTYYNISKNKPGPDGTPATSYWLAPSDNSVKITKAGGIVPATLSCVAWKQVGDATPESLPLTGNVWPRILYSTDGSTFDRYVGTPVNVSSTMENITFVLSGETAQYDIEDIPVVKDGADGTSPYILDLNNQNASVNCDAEGNILPGAMMPECKATFYHGSTEASNAQYYILTGSTQHAGVSINQNTGDITCTGGVFTFVGDNLTLTIEGVSDGISARTFYNISKNKPGPDGTPATSYWLKPLTNSWSVNKSGIFTPTGLTCEAWKQVGTQTPVQLDLTSATGPRILMSIDSETGGSHYTGGTITATTANTFVQFVLTNEDGSVQYDVETVPIVKDGIDGTPGTSPFVFDLDNQNVSINCDKDGNMLTGATKPVCHAILRHGTSTITSNVTYDISAWTTTFNNGVTIANDGTITINNGLAFTGNLLILTISATYSGETFYAYYNISKSLPGPDGTPATSRWLVPSTTAVKVSNADVTSPSAVSCTAEEQIGDNAPTTLPLTGDVDIRVYYATGGTFERYTGGDIVTTTAMTEICFVLSGNNVQYDIETIPLVRDGKDGQSAYRIDVDNQSMAVNCDAEGNILAGAVKPSSTVSLYLGASVVEDAVYEIVTASTTYTDITLVPSSNTGATVTLGNNLAFNADILELKIGARLTAGGAFEAAVKVNIAKNKAGINGEPATTYWLAPSTNSIKIVDSSLTHSISCKSYMQVGDGASEETTTSSITTMYYDYVDGEPGSAYTGSVISIPGNTANEQIRFKLVKDGVEVDIETIPILRDGENGDDGTSPYTLILDNQNISLVCNSAGTIVGGTSTTSTAHLYHGTTAITSNVTFAFNENPAQRYGVTINSSTGVISLSALANTTGFPGESLSLTVNATYSSITYSTKFNVSKVKEGAKGDDGTSPYTLIIDNPNMSVSCDSGGTIIPGALKPSATATLYCGNTPVGYGAVDYDFREVNTYGVDIDTDHGTISLDDIEDFSGDVLTLTVEAEYHEGDVPKIARAKLNISKAKQGGAGAEGRVGVTIRRSVWESGKTYYDGTQNDGYGNYYLDIVTDTSIAFIGDTGATYKQCIEAHTGWTSDIPAEHKYTFSNTTAWTEISSSEPLATPLLLAGTISADYLDVTRLDVKSGNTYLLRVGSIEEPDYPFLCGGSTSSNAVTKIDSAGTFTTVAGMIGGWKITETAIASNDDTFALDSETKSLVISENDTPRTIINGTINSFNDVLDGGQTQYNVGAGVNTPASSYTYTYYQGWLNHDFYDTHNSPTFEINSTSEVTFYDINFSLEIWARHFDYTLIEHPNSYEGSIAMSLYAKDSNYNRVPIATKTISWSSLSDANCPFGGGSHPYSMSFTKKTITLQAGTYSLEGYFYLNVPIRSDNPYTGLEYQDGNDITFSFTTSRSTTATTSFEMKLNRFFGNGLSTSINSSNAILLFGNDMLTDRFSASGGYRNYSAESSHFMVISKAGCTASTGDIPTFYENGIDIGTYTGTSYSQPFVSYFRIKLNNDNNWTILSAPNNKLPSYLRVGNCALWSSTINTTITSTNFHNYKYMLFSGSSSTSTATWTLPGATTAMCDGDYMFIMPYMGKITLKIGSDMEAYVSFFTTTTMVDGPDTVLTIPMWNTALVSFHAAGTSRLPCYFIRIF